MKLSRSIYTQDHFLELRSLEPEPQVVIEAGALVAKEGMESLLMQKLHFFMKTVFFVQVTYF